MKRARAPYRFATLIATRFALAVWVGLFAATTASHGEVTAYSTAFESPFVTGNLSGQQGWSSVASIISPAVIESGGNGGQGVELTRGAGFGAVADANYLYNLSQATLTDYVQVQWDMRVVGTGATPKPFGPFFGVDSFVTDSTTRRVGYVGLDATTGEVLYSQPGSGALLVDNNIVPLNIWHRWSMVMDFDSKTYDVTVNSIPVLSSIGFVDPSADIHDFVAAALTTFAASQDPQSIDAGGTAYFDNYVIRTGDPPLAGDLDLDGFVGVIDLNLVLGRWNLNVTPGELLLGDPTGDGFVGIEDLSLVLSNWNVGTPPTVSGSASLPEPGALMIVAVGGLGLLRRTRV